MTRIVIKNDTLYVNPEKQDAVLIMDTENLKFETAVPASAPIYHEVFKIFMWLLSDSERAQKIMTLASLSYYLEQEEQSAKAKPEKKPQVHVRSNSMGLAEELFKKVLGGK